MKRPRRPLFLDHAPYRRRRLRDAARILPIFGAFLFVLPALWSPRGEGLRSLSTDVIYFFLAWALLVLIAGLFATGLVGRGRPEDED